MKFLFHICLLLFTSCIPKEVSDLVTADDQLSTDEVAKGLKQALEIGVTKGSEELAKVDGYYKSPYKIFLPEEARKIADKLQVVPGFSDWEEDMTEKLNRAAEDAAKKAAPIFKDAITGMTIGDAFDILKGEDNAATIYLQSKTENKLYDEFRPVIHNSLDEVGAIDLWKDGVTAYNKIPFIKKMNPELDDHVTNEALDGLFHMVAKEEKEIRKNPVSRTTDLLKKVFGSLD